MPEPDVTDLIGIRDLIDGAEIPKDVYWESAFCPSCLLSANPELLSGRAEIAARTTHSLLAQGEKFIFVIGKKYRLTIEALEENGS